MFSKLQARTTAVLGLALAASTASFNPAFAQGDPPDADHEWGVHDPNRPMPPVVEPGTFPTQEQAGTAPSDAIVLFDGSNLDAWNHNGWQIENGELVCAPGKGDIKTKANFGDCQLHVEWLIPESAASKEGQNRGNSGVFLMDTYEIQVLDNKNNNTYADGIAGSVYGQSPAMVNAGLGLGKWQTYDIIFRRPHFNEAGECVQPGTVTVLFNGVLVQDHWVIEGPTWHMRRSHYTPHADALPIRFQDHGQPTRFRNVWIRPLAEKTAE